MAIVPAIRDLRPESSSISFRRAVVYGLGILATSAAFRMWRLGLYRGRLFDRSLTLEQDECYYQRAAR